MSNWTPDADDDPAGASQLIAKAQRDPIAFLASLSNPEGKGSPVVLEDGTEVPRLPFARYWISDGEYAGELNLRWQHGTSELPLLRAHWLCGLTLEARRKLCQHSDTSTIANSAETWPELDRYSHELCQYRIWPDSGKSQCHPAKRIQCGP